MSKAFAEHISFYNKLIRHIRHRIWRAIPPALKKLHKKHLTFIKGKRYDLIIIDDLLPIPLTPWRNFEYENILKTFPDSKVILDFTNTLLMGDKNYIQHYKELKQGYPLLAEKIYPIRTATSINAKLVYMLFYNNIKRYYTLLQSKKINYGFLLYPGGGFKLNNEECNKVLTDAISSPYCKFVITDQQINYNYLTQTLGLPAEKIFFVYGLPLPFIPVSGESSYNQKFFSGSKPTIDIVFMAHKYRPFGKDKGFDTFQNIVARLKGDKAFKFHVVGNLTQADLLQPELAEHMKFYGHLNEHLFEGFFSDKDIIISPNRPNVLAPGAFDGFPLGSSLVAGYYTCVMMLANELNESPDIFTDKVHYLKIKPEENDIIAKLTNMKDNPQLMKTLALAGREKIIEVYCGQAQIRKRIEILGKFL